MITMLYAGLSALLVVGLSARVIVLRNVHRVEVGDGGHRQLQLAIRAHGNALEYLPLTLLLLWMLETAAVAPWALHLSGSALLVGRLIHAYSIPARILKLRVLGMVLTFASLVGNALAGLYLVA